MRQIPLQSKLGALLFEGPSVLAGLSARPFAWVKIKNRNDALVEGPHPPGVTPLWDGTRSLHFCEVFPSFGCTLLRRCLRDVTFEADRPHSVSEAPEVSVLIGHRGEDRLPLLLEVLAGIHSQSGTPFECIVCEYDTHPRARNALPSWVRYIFSASNGRPFNRSRAFNVAAQSAKGKFFLLHDNDLVVPSDYLSSHVQVLREGWDVANLKRFIFYLDEAETTHSRGRVRFVMQNARGGGSVAISAAAFQAIGGMDDSFEGWGGEDEEFWDRCRTLRVCDSQYLPLIHLWHPPQSGKRQHHGRGAHTAAYFEQCMQIPASERITRLRSALRAADS